MLNDLTNDAHLMRRISVEAFCDPRSVARFLNGEEQRPTTRARIEQAFEHLGIERPKRRRPS